MVLSSVALEHWSGLGFVAILKRKHLEKENYILRLFEQAVILARFN